jgi:hypothetical protein
VLVEAWKSGASKPSHAEVWEKLVDEAGGIDVVVESDSARAPARSASR